MAAALLDCVEIGMAFRSLLESRSLRGVVRTVKAAGAMLRDGYGLGARAARPAKRSSIGRLFPAKNSWWLFRIAR
jgi:hypothetical protein